MSLFRRTMRASLAALTVLAVLALLVYSILVVINLKDQDPSEETIRISELVESYDMPDDRDNAYLHFLAFAAPPKTDILELGIARRDWMLDARPDFDCCDDPLPEDYRPHAGRSDALQELSRLCKDPGPACMELLGNSKTLLSDWIESERWLLDRYRQLITMRQFREFVPYDILAPLPSYDVILDSQKLLFLEALSQAGNGDPEAVRDLLDNDLQFWRVVLRDSDGLITKMIAVAAVSRNFKFGNRLLAGLPANLIAMATPESWQRELTIAERSMERVLASESLFATNVAWRINKKGQNPYGYVYGNAGWWDTIRWSIMKPLWQPQDSINRYSALLMAVADLFDNPLESMPQAARDEDRLFEAAFRPFSRVYNLAGDLFYSDFRSRMSNYGLRVTDLEGVRRAALLAAQMRSDGVNRQDAPQAIAASALTNPYSGKPFKWNADEAAIVVFGLDSTGGTHFIYYQASDRFNPVSSEFRFHRGRRRAAPSDSATGKSRCERQAGCNETAAEVCENSMTTVGAASSRDWALVIISSAYRSWKPLLRLSVVNAGVFTQPLRKRLQK